MDNVYSISRIDCINECLYQAYHTYRLDNRGDDNVWGICGGTIHEVLENIVKGTATESDLLPALEFELRTLDSLGVDFPKDARGGTAIRDGWIGNITDFCHNYKSPRGKNLQAEVEVHYITPNNNNLIGYIDLLWTKSDKTVEIFDYKTSSLYKGDDLIKHGRQLVLYQLALEQMGYTVKAASWIFLKYVAVSYLGYKKSNSKEKTELTKVVERRKIVSELESSIRTELAEQNCSDVEIDFLMEDALKTNTIPTQVSHLYTIKPYVMPYEITEEVKQECIDYIDSTIKMWEALSDEDCQKSHREFTRTQKNGKVVNDIYSCLAICPHKNRCPFIQDFLVQEQVGGTSEEDLF